MTAHVVSEAEYRWYNHCRTSDHSESVSEHEPTDIDHITPLPSDPNVRVAQKRTGRRPWEHDGPWCQPNMLAKATPARAYTNPAFTLKT